MKKTKVCYCFFVLLLTIVGCQQSTYNRVLLDADRLMEENTDSAYMLLQGISEISEHGDDASRAFYALLQTQACYKLYKPTPPDSLIRSALNYYQQAGDKSLYARACYYRAMTLYEKGCHDEALLLLKKGEQAATEIEDTLQMSKYHESLCMVNDLAGCNDLMLKYAKQFLNDAIQLKDTVLIVRGLDHVGSAYTRMGKLDDSKQYKLQTLPLVSKMDKEGLAYILTNLACSLHKRGNLAEAKSYLLLSLETNPMPNTYAELGDVYAEEGDIDQAESCWSKSVTSDNPQTVINTLSSMLVQYRRQNNYEKALTTLERMHQLKDSLHRASELASIAEIQYKYDKQVVERKLYQTLTWTLAAALFAVLAAIVFIYYHRHTVKANSNQLAAMEDAILSKQRQIAVLENSGEEHQQEINELQQQIASIQKQTYERLGIGKRIYDNIAAGRHLLATDDEHCLIEYYSVIQFETYNQWMRDYQGLTARQLVILMLLGMGKTDAEIAQILCVSYGAVRTNKSRIKAKKTAKKDS